MFGQKREKINFVRMVYWKETTCYKKGMNERRFKINDSVMNFSLLKLI